MEANIMQVLKRGLSIAALLGVGLGIIATASCRGCSSSSSDGGSGDQIGSCPFGTMPTKGTPFTDPDYGTTIVRITNKTVDGYAGPGIENEYARSDPENSNGRYVILRGNDGQWYLYDAASYQMLQQLNIIATGGEEPEPRWDATDPDVFYFLDGSQLKSYTITTKAITVVHDFSPAAMITTKTEGDASLDRRYWCLMLEDGDYNITSLVVYDRTEDRIIGQLNPPYKDGINWVSMDMSGTHCVIGYEDSDNDRDDKTPPVDVFDRNFNFVVTLPEGSTGHMDLALAANARDVMVYQNNATDWIAMADLTTGAETNLVKIPFDVNPDIGIHVSGNCSATPGRVLISTYNSFDPPPGSTHSWMDNLLFLVELKASPKITKLAHTCAYTSQEYSGEKNYFAEAFAAINTAGTRIYYGSNWCMYTADYSDAYAVSIP